MRLQYRTMGSNGEIWIDCQDRFDEFIQDALGHKNWINTVEPERAEIDKKEILEMLTSGGTVGISLRAEIRDADSIPPRPEREKETRKLYRCRKCGQTGYAHQYPFSTMAGGDICDDCL